MEAQTGFRKNTGTIDNIFILHGVINHMLNGKKYMLLLLNYAVRENIWYKPLNNRVRGKIIYVIRSMHDNIKSRVKYDYRLSNDFTCL